jgi:hypothetical protein
MSDEHDLDAMAVRRADLIYQRDFDIDLILNTGWCCHWWTRPVMTIDNVSGMRLGDDLETFRRRRMQRAEEPFVIVHETWFPHKPKITSALVPPKKGEKAPDPDCQG